MGAWIEIVAGGNVSSCSIWSLPTWERGLKFGVRARRGRGYFVAPYMGAWIEICRNFCDDFACFVAPYMGAWIEITS